MMTDHLRKVVERLSQLPAPVQEQVATEIEMSLEQRLRSATSTTPPPPDTAAAPPPLEASISTLDLAGVITDPAVKALTAREIDELLAEEAGAIQHAAE